MIALRVTFAAEATRPRAGWTGIGWTMSIGDSSRRLIAALAGLALGKLAAALLGAALVTASATASGWPAAARVRGASYANQRTVTLLTLLRGGATSHGLSTLGLLIPDLARQHPLVPEPGVFSALLGVYCTSRASCWAVGAYEPTSTTALNEVLHWNGSRWLRVFVPEPAGTGNGDANVLNSVRCVRATDCWAVGVYEKVQGVILGQALHWNGRKWFLASVPQSGGTTANSVTLLQDVVCPSAANCWAVGEFGTQGTQLVLRNEALHWNGRKWTRAGTPQPAGTAVDDVNQLLTIRCTSNTSCLAVGDYGSEGAKDILLNEALRWNGKHWSVLDVPDPGGTDTSGDTNRLAGLACSSSINCWAVGFYGPTGPVPSFSQVLHWNGSGWSQIAVPEPGGMASDASQELLFVACGSPVSCWAVGDFAPVGSRQVTVNLAMHWDGGMWSVVDTPDPAGVSTGDRNILSAVRCVSAGNCWAVGMARVPSGNDFAQVLHWGGSRWSVR